LRWTLWTIRAATAAGLAIDAYVHLDLAAVYREAGGVISEGVLFCRGQRAGMMLAARSVDLGQIGGPLPLYDAAWFPEKLLGGGGRRAREGCLH
jgi:hypothetical protein